MHDLIDRLHRDHANMAELLDLFGRQVDCLYDSSADADYHLMRDIVAWFAHFPDAVHHPAEDLLYELLARRQPACADTVATLARDHAVLGALTRDLAGRLEAVCAGQLVERPALVAAAAEFLARQRAHIDAEEGQVFPLLRDALDGADRAAATLRYESRHDPLFGERVEDAFRRVREAIVAAA